MRVALNCSNTWQDSLMALRVATYAPWWSERPFALFHGRENKGARWTSHLRPRISSPTGEKKVNSST
jgi:hypothetical protein